MLFPNSEQVLSTAIQVGVAVVVPAAVPTAIGINARSPAAAVGRSILIRGWPTHRAECSIQEDKDHGNGSHLSVLLWSSGNNRPLVVKVGRRSYRMSSSSRATSASLPPCASPTTRPPASTATTHGVRLITGCPPGCSSDSAVAATTTLHCCSRAYSAAAATGAGAIASTVSPSASPEASQDDHCGATRWVWTQSGSNIRSSVGCCGSKGATIPSS